MALSGKDVFSLKRPTRVHRAMEVQPGELAPSLPIINIQLQTIGSLFVRLKTALFRGYIDQLLGDLKMLVSM